MLNALANGYAALWRVDALGFGADKRASSAAAVAPAARSEPAAKKKKAPARLSIHDRLRALMGPVITEEELQEKLEFGRLLGSGATAKVYAAVDTRSGREVSVKVFDKAAMVEVRRSMVADGSAATEEKAVHRVRRRLLKILSEMEISKSLDHPNIIKYLGAYETDHRLCIVHELVEGSDLLEHLLEHGKMDEGVAAGVFAQLLSALQYCHERNVYHRDLKLENVLLSTDMQVKLIDFGLSEVVYPGDTLSTMCGTPLYCSPEVLFLHTKSRPRTSKGFFGGPADVWSIGILIFALLTGCAPFDDSTFQRLRHEVARRAIAYPAHLSDEVKGLLKEVLVFDPFVRPTVADLLEYPWFSRERPPVSSSASSTAVAASPSIVEHLAVISADSEVLSESVSDLESEGEDEGEDVPNQEEEEEEDKKNEKQEEGEAAMAKCARSLSCHSAARTEGTSSANSSLEDARRKAGVGLVASSPSAREC